MTTEQVYKWLEAVKDPEIPVLSLVDLGVITSLHIENRSVTVGLTPTFVGCPALEMMKEDITNELLKNGAEHVAVNVTYEQPWSSDLISERGKMALKQFGLAPPPDGNLF